jgi:hypothetical protein
MPGVCGCSCHETWWNDQARRPLIVSVEHRLGLELIARLRVIQAGLEDMKLPGLAASLGSVIDDFKIIP